MKETSACEHVGELVSVLYGEATEREQREFDVHMKQCATCRAEFAAFAQVREAIGDWRDEALNRFVSSPMVAAPPRKSAVAALRQFFDLSPLWMKGAIAFAAVAFCVLVVLAFGRFTSSSRDVTKVASKNPDAVYTKEDINRAVETALAKQASQPQSQGEQRVIETPKPNITVGTSGSKRSALAKSAPQARRPFSRAEREQLAAELRLISADDSDLELPEE